MTKTVGFYFIYLIFVLLFIDNLTSSNVKMLGAHNAQKHKKWLLNTKGRKEEIYTAFRIVSIFC